MTSNDNSTAPVEELTLPLPAPLPTITAVVTSDTATGAVRYRLTGPRLAGSFTVAAEGRPDTVLPDRITLTLGAPDATGTIIDRPTVNGIETTGGTTLDISQIPHLWLSARRRRSHADLPHRSEAYLAAVARAVLTHWATRPDRDALTLAAARHYAPRRLQHLQQNTIEPLRQKITALTDRLTDAEQLAKALESLAAPPADPAPQAPDIVSADHLKPAASNAGR